MMPHLNAFTRYKFLNPHGDGFIYALYTIGLAAFVFIIEIIVVPMTIIDMRNEPSLRTKFHYLLVSVGVFYIFGVGFMLVRVATSL